MAASHKEARGKLIGLLEKQKRFSDLRILIEETLKISSTNEEALKAKVRLDQVQTQISLLRAEAQKAKSPETHLQIGIALYEAGDFEAAIQQGREALASEKGAASAFNLICASLNALGRFAQAVAECEKALKSSRL